MSAFPPAFMLVRWTTQRSLYISIKGFAVTNGPPNMKARVCYVCSDKLDNKNEDKSGCSSAPTGTKMQFVHVKRRLRAIKLPQYLIYTPITTLINPCTSNSN